MTTEFLFLADSGGISFYHHDDNGHIRDGLPAGQKPDLSLVYSASEIIPLVHDTTISKRGASVAHNVSSANIVVWENFSWAFPDIFFALYKEERKKVLPLSAAVLYWANQFFGPPEEDRQVILTIGQLSRPITYVITLKEGRLTDSILHGADAGKQFTRTCKEVVHVELLYDHPPDTAVEFNPPSADKSETISLSRFIAECELRPLAMRRGGKVAIPLSLALYPLAAFSVIWVALYFAESRLQEKIDLQKMSIDITNQQIDFARQAVKQEWERALSFYINQERENIMPTFEIIDTRRPNFTGAKFQLG